MKNNQMVETHPCFSQHCNDYARLHLPVAPACNIQCNYCVRKFSCVNECRPGVTARVIQADEAVEQFLQVKGRMPNLTVVGIAGPGDALANWTEVSKTLCAIRKADAEISLCLSTNGLLLPRYVDNLIRLEVGYVTVTMNCVDPAIGADIYEHVTLDSVTYKGIDGVSLLLKNQLVGIKMLKQHGVKVKINTVAIKGVNEQHIIEVAKTAANLQCDYMNIIPMLPVAGSAFEDLREIYVDELANIRKDCAEYIPQMWHCNRCRADAVGKLR